MKQRFAPLFFLLHHFGGFGYYYFTMAGGTGGTRQAAFAGGVGVAKRPCSPFHAQSAWLTGSSVPSASECPKGRGAAPGHAPGGGCLRHCWQDVRRANSSAPEKKCITFANLVHNLQTAPFEGF